MSHPDASRAVPVLQVGFNDAWTTVDPNVGFGIGRAADLSVDDENPYLHRRLLEIRYAQFWTISNVGTRLSATLSDIEGGGVHAWLAPGAVIPLVMRTTEVRFTAGATTYRIALHLSAPLMSLRPLVADRSGGTTLAPITLTDLQRLLVLSLAEPTLQEPTKDITAVPPSADAARRLGWTITKFNRQLDAVCQKLGRAGVEGVQGDLGSLASNRRSRLVEYAMATRLVTIDDLVLLRTVDAAEAPLC